MAQLVKVLAAKSVDMSSILQPPQTKRKIDSFKLSSDFYIYAVVKCAHTESK